MNSPIAPYGANTSAGSGAGGVLDMATIDYLRQLDPTGGNGLLKRVLHTFEASVQSFQSKLQAALDSADLEAIRFQTHKLKSSSAGIGALSLSRLCAEVEQFAREGRLEAARERIGPLLREADAVLLALRHVPDAG